MIFYLKGDFYGMTFASFHATIARRNKIKVQTQNRNFYTCMWIVTVEVALIAMIFKSVVIDVDEFKIETPDVGVFLCRFLSAVLLHLEL